MSRQSAGDYSIGNRVWNDDGSGGGGESSGGINGVEVQLLDGSGNIIATMTTANAGYYRFDNLAEGDYRVRIPASNFITGILVGWNSSSASANEADPNSDVDMDDNGVGTISYPLTGITSGVITLGPGDSEPTNERDLGADDPGPNSDERANLTVDFGFIRLDANRAYSVGNRVWLDDGAFSSNRDDGIRQGAEPGIANVLINLVDSNGNFLVSTLTSANGYYRFDNLPVGNYRLEAAASNFLLGGPLQGLLSSSADSPNPNDNQDNDDNGIGSLPDPVTGIRSNAITLGPGEEPGGEGDQDISSRDENWFGPHGNLRSNTTVDFGFTTDLLPGEPTSTASPTATTSPIPTETLTLTPTFTGSPSPTYTPTLTETFTSTPTESPSATSTSSLTPTLTDASTLTATSSFTPTPSLTPTLTPSSTTTHTGVPTLPNTSTLTATSSFTPTPSLTPTLIPSATTTYTVVPTLPNTSTPTATSSFTPTTSSTPALIPSARATLTAIPTLTSTLTPTYTTTANSTQTHTPTPTATTNPTLEATITASRTHTTTQSVVTSPTNTPSSTASLQSVQAAPATTSSVDAGSTATSGIADPIILSLDDATLMRRGETVTFTVSALNRGTAAAQNVFIEDQLPAEYFTVQSATTTKGTLAIAKNSVTVTINVFDPGEVVTLRVVARVSDSAPIPSNAVNNVTMSYLGGQRRYASVPMRITSGNLPATGERPDDRAVQALVVTLGAAIFGLAFMARRRSVSA